MQRSKPMTLDEARETADRFISLVKDTCERIEVAGSVRRGKPNPNDIEIVVVPTIDVGTVGPVNLFDERCAELIERGILEPRVDAAGRTAWGERAKRAVIFLPNGRYAPLDIFSVLPPATWGVVFAIRTGPGPFNKWVVTNERFGGACPANRKVAGGRVWDLGKLPEERQAELAAMPSNRFLRQKHGCSAIPTPEERDFFAALHLPFWPPEKRTEKRIQEWIRAKQRGRTDEC